MHVRRSCKSVPVEYAEIYSAKPTTRISSCTVAARISSSSLVFGVYIVEGAAEVLLNYSCHDLMQQPF